MKLTIYNSLGRHLEEVEPIEGDTIRVYSCGPTVYDFAHIGNLRKYIFDDLLVRTLGFLGYKTKHVMNITDVGHLVGDGDEGEDKLEVGSRREGKSAQEIAKYFEKEFFLDEEKLNIKKPEIVCRATEHISEQIDLVKILFEKGFAYQISDGVYFDTSKFADYGKLAGLNVAGQIEGSRVEINPDKRNPSDFALWKFSFDCAQDGAQDKKSFDGAQDDGSSHRQMEWESPWGVGFPGWHLECSAMSTKYLGQPFEIHTGGVDHIAVHHTNEIAQSEAACDKPLAKYWVHSEFILQDGHKMAKSEGHFLRLSDLQEKGFSPLDYRYLCLSSHYRSKLNFTWESLNGARQAREKIIQFGYIAEGPSVLSGVEGGGSDESRDFYIKAIEDISRKLSDDLNTPEAFAIIFQTISQAHHNNYLCQTDIKYFLETIDKVFALDLIGETYSQDGIRSKSKLPEEILNLAKQRNQARQAKDYGKADDLKQKIVSAGYDIEDGQTHTSIDKSSH
jgi:cysteinyl-tRNA synthetase